MHEHCPWRSTGRRYSSAGLFVCPLSNAFVANYASLDVIANCQCSAHVMHIPGGCGVIAVSCVIAAVSYLSYMRLEMLTL